MSKDVYIRLKCSEEFKAQIKSLASKEKTTVSVYIESLIIKEVQNGIKRNRIILQKKLQICKSGKRTIDSVVKYAMAVGLLVDDVYPNNKYIGNEYEKWQQAVTEYIAN